MDTEKKMFRMDSIDHIETVKKTLRKERPVDERTLACLAVLKEKLNLLKKADKRFEAIGFSSDIEKLRNQASKIAVC